jgi:hypothetical protein
MVAVDDSIEAAGDFVLPVPVIPSGGPAYRLDPVIDCAPIFLFGSPGVRVVIERAAIET